MLKPGNMHNGIEQLRKWVVGGRGPWFLLVEWKIIDSTGGQNDHALESETLV